MKKSLLSLLFAVGMAGAAWAQPASDALCAAFDCAYHHQHRQASTAQTSAEHLALMRQYDVTFHHLDVAVERTSTAISGHVRTRAVALAPLGAFGFELHPNLAIDSVLINGVPAVVTRAGGDATATSTTPLDSGQTFEARIYYGGLPPSGASAAIGNGISNGTSGAWGNRITWTLSQPFSAYEWWPCKQDLPDKIDSIFVSITTSDDNKAGSNGLLVASTPLPDGRIRYDWQSRYPIAYYLVSLAVGRYVDYSFYAYPANSDSVLIQNYVYDNPATLPFWKNSIDITADMLEFFADRFGPYPFAAEKYGHSMAPLGGGMEHQTMTTQGTFDFGLTAHELGHQWFGDHVTCRTWAHIWVNEGFATYTEYLAREALLPNTAPNWLANTQGRIVSFAPTGSVFVADSNNVNRIFNYDRSYLKGAAILHTLRYVVGDSLFFAGCRAYLNTFGNGTATANDFRDVMASTTGQDLTTFFDEWYYGEGYPRYQVRWNYDAGQLILQTAQTTSASTPSLFTTPVTYRVRRTNGVDTLLVIAPTQNTETHTFELSPTVVSIQVDPANWITKTATVARDQTITSLQAPEAVRVQVYPNPCRDRLQLRGASAGTFTAYDLTGRVVCRQVLRSAEAKVDVRTLPPGVYVFRLTGADLPYYGRFVKE